MTSLTSINEPLLKYKSGIKAILEMWDILETAIIESWGDNINITPEDQVIQFTDNIVELFILNDDLDRLDIEDYITLVMNDNYMATIEDGSIERMANLFFTMYTDVVKKQNYIGLNKILTKRSTYISKIYTIQPKDTSDSEDDDVEDEKNDNMELQEEEEEPTISNLTIEEVEDGWSEVPKRGNNKKK